MQNNCHTHKILMQEKKVCSRFFLEWMKEFCWIFYDFLLSFCILNGMTSTNDSDCLHVDKLRLFSPYKAHEIKIYCFSLLFCIICPNSSTPPLSSGFSQALFCPMRKQSKWTICESEEMFNSKLKKNQFEKPY